jgi:hypothetical protein
MVSQPKKKWRLSVFEIPVIVLFGLALIWVYGFPPESPSQWIHWFLSGDGHGGPPFFWTFSKFCILICLLLILRSRRH